MCCVSPRAFTHKHFPFFRIHSSVHPGPPAAPQTLGSALKGNKKMAFHSEPRDVLGDLQTKSSKFGGSGPPEVMDKPLASGVVRPPQEAP